MEPKRIRFHAKAKDTKRWIPDQVRDDSEDSPPRRTRIHTSQAPATRSKDRQKFGHQAGTPGLAIRPPRKKSNRPWPASPRATNHRLVLKPITARAAKAASTRLSAASAGAEPAITANRS